MDYIFQDTTVSLLIGFIEQAESNALLVAQQHGVNALRDNPDSMGTSLDMLRRAANTLNNLARHQDNAPLFLRNDDRVNASECVHSDWLIDPHGILL